jgi:dipeptidyl-peptidase-4
MNVKMTVAFILFLVEIFLLPVLADGQQIKWTKDGNSFYMVEDNSIILNNLVTKSEKVLVPKKRLTLPDGQLIEIRDFTLSDDGNKILMYTNSQFVWRIDTQGDYWVLELALGKLQKVGPARAPSSMRFAKFSPDGKKVAYVSEYNLYVYDLATATETSLTGDGNRRYINGTFDWVYEEEFACRDGFQWSPDGKHIAFFNVDASGTKDFNMINYTDSVYSRIIPVEYPKVGESPSAVRIGVIEVASGKNTWLNIPGDARQHYLPRMEWNSANELFVQQLNRKQNQSIIYNCSLSDQKVKEVFRESDEAWIDVYSPWEDVYNITYRHQLKWITQNNEFIWISEKDGWRHVYRISKAGKINPVTKGNFDVINLLHVDEQNNLVYFHASPANATQKYLYKTKLDGTGAAERVTPAGLDGTHSYEISPNGKFALHVFENITTPPIGELITLPDNKPINEAMSIARNVKQIPSDNKVEFFTIQIADGTQMDGWMVKPKGFDPSKKYPVLFHVYTEPWGAEVTDKFGTGQDRNIDPEVLHTGYIYISIDNRGTPAPKGRAWRKAIYRKIGRLNISDQAMAAKEVMKWPFVDTSRIAVTGYSGGGAATINLMCQYPEIYKVGLAGAAVVNQLTYDNIYQERYMGLPQENKEDFLAGSPITYAKNLRGKLLYIHGTADDNVHYANAELLLNELIKHNKQFTYMAYPNRSHSLREGEGTMEHVRTLYTSFLVEHCPPGGR